MAKKRRGKKKLKKSGQKKGYQRRMGNPKTLRRVTAPRHFQNSRII